MNKQQKIQILGKISGMPYSYAKGLFDDAECWLQLRYINGKIINPTKLCNKNMLWFTCMFKCLYSIIFCANSVYLLDNWKQSRGAKIELFIALLFNKKIL